MSSRLSKEIATLAVKARHQHITDQQIIERLTAIVGYGHLIEHHPHCRVILLKQLEAFIQLVCHHGHRELCEQSERIREITDEKEEAT